MFPNNRESTEVVIVDQPDVAEFTQDSVDLTIQEVTEVTDDTVDLTVQEVIEEVEVQQVTKEQEQEVTEEVVQEVIDEVKGQYLHV